MFVLVICIEILNYYSNFKKIIHFLNHYKTLFWDHIDPYRTHYIFLYFGLFVRLFFCFRHWNHVNKKDKKEQIVNHNMWALEKKGRRLENYSSFNSYGTEIIYIYIYKQHYLQMDKNNGIPFEREEQDSWLVDLIALVIKNTCFFFTFYFLDGSHKFCHSLQGKKFNGGISHYIILCNIIKEMGFLMVKQFFFNWIFS